MRKVSTLLLFLIVISGCASNKSLTHYEIPPDLRNEVIKNEIIKKYSFFLSGRKIFLDPGHGGSDRRSIGKLGLVYEADVNLRVALALREYLTKAGAIVFMSREKDETVELKKRSEMANQSNADIFISIHHNAPGTTDDVWTNYTSTYFHALDTDSEFEPCQHDLARYIQRDLAYVMGNSGGLGSFDGTYSDYTIYPKAGFSVLRLTQIPAILVECSFFTNSFEERRLDITEFNNIEAWGIFRGLAKYFKSGIPQITPLNNQQFVAGDIELAYKIADPMGINPKSIEVYFDSVSVKSNFDQLQNILTVNLLRIKPGIHSIRILCSNNNGNYAFPYRKSIVVQPTL
ncbi:MAG: N-acetylmuramoyl-L-alanine amidase family protein [Methanococcaceae archaeon]